MPLKLNVSVSKKVGQPDFGSLGAVCGVELELSEGLLQSDLDAFQRQVRDAYVVCDQAVSDELARHQARPTPPRSNGQAATGPDHGPAANNGRAASRTTGARAVKPATPNQIKALYAIAHRQHADLDGLLRDEYGVERPDDLSLSEASRLIDQLKAAGAV